MPNKKSEKSLLISCLISQIYWIVSAIVLMLIIGAVAVSLENPAAVLVPLCLATLYLSAIISGIAAVRYSHDGVLSGLLSGVITSALVMLLSFIPFPSSGLDTTTSLICALLVIPAAAIGSILGRKKENTRKMIAKKRKIHK